MTSLEIRIEQASSQCDALIEDATAARDRAVAEARLVWEPLSLEELVSLAIASEAWLCGRLPTVHDSREIVLEALEHAEGMRLDKSGACGHDLVVKSLDRLAALVSHRRLGVACDTARVMGEKE